ncbi:MAG: prepilin-type N-terminal cleavage/methylation domain-containing protein [Tepidisphaeraceae bacterium]|jgi:prepilin-type N-terminal cleavage/methylation domain-containing protein
MRRRSGFTLVEVLVTLMFLAITLPAIMQGISLATKVGAQTVKRTEAAGLAQSQLAEIVSTGQWQNGNLSGDFGAQWPSFRWEANVQPWAADTTDASLQQIDVTVFWTDLNKQDSVTLTTLAYAREQE